jgi:hypothetical protein
MISHKWAIERMDSLVDYNGNPNIIHSVFFSVTTKDSNSVYTVIQNQSVQLNYQGSVEFIDYADITEEIALGWVKEALNTRQDILLNADGIPKINADGSYMLSEPYAWDGCTPIEESGEMQLNEMINPKIVTLPLPWQTVN